MAELAAERRQRMMVALQNAFEGAGWRVASEPRIENVRLDLFLISPSRRFYVVELKITEGSEHFTSIAQVASVESLVRKIAARSAIHLAGAAIFGPVMLVPLVLSSGILSRNFLQTAEKFDVKVLGIDPDNPEESARSIVEQLGVIDSSLGRRSQ